MIDNLHLTPNVTHYKRDIQAIVGISIQLLKSVLSLQLRVIMRGTSTRIPHNKIKSATKKNKDYDRKSLIGEKMFIL